MTTTTEQTKEERLQEVFRCAMDSIAEMVQALDRDASAESYADNLTREQCVCLLTDEAGIECYDSESLDELQEAVAENIKDETIEPSDFEFDADEARQRIDEDPLSLQIRSGWCSLGDEMEPEEYELLLVTGGPAVRIIGTLDRGEAATAVLQVQDWFTPWTEFATTSDERDTLMAYANCFYGIIAPEIDKHGN